MQLCIFYDTTTRTRSSSETRLLRLSLAQYIVATALKTENTQITELDFNL